MGQSLLRMIAIAAAVLGVLAPASAVSAASTVGPALPVLLAAGMPTDLTLGAEERVIAYGGSSILTGRLTDPVTGSGVAGATIRLETRSVDGTWAEAAVLVTDGSGAVSSAQAPTTTTTYRLRHGDPGLPEESTSPEVTVGVSAATTATLSRDAVRAGRPVTVSGVVLPAEADVTLELQRRSAGTWRRLGSTSTAPDGSYTLGVTPETPGTWSLRVVRAAGGLRPASAVDLPRLTVFRLHRYTVIMRGAIRADIAVFREEVAATYADPRGWAAAHHRFRAVPARSGRSDFTVVLSQARYLPAFSSVCSTTYSCRVGRYVIINQDRWRRGSPYFPGTLEQYRRMVVNHETGHWLGRGHAFCSGRDRPAPVMQQQSKGLFGCRVNPWPLSREVMAVS